MTLKTDCSNTSLSGKKYNTIRIKNLQEVFQDYKKYSLLIGVCFCDWKCCLESGIPVTVCQNHNLESAKFFEVSFDYVLKTLNESYADALIIGGLEPFMQTDEVVQLLKFLRENGVKKDLLVYTGYYLEEIDSYTIGLLSDLNVILKCGRYIPDRPSNKIDPVLGIKLASSNQYGVKL